MPQSIQLRIVINEVHIKLISCLPDDSAASERDAIGEIWELCELSMYEKIEKVKGEEFLLAAAVITSV